MPSGLKRKKVQVDAEHSRLDMIPVSKIDRNPDNPRIIFREEEMDALLRSIRTHGIQVPIAVYKHGRRYVLVDGERRWTCALRLSLDTVPALVQQKPTRLKNLLLMFNIHSLREQWDYMTIAMKLPIVIEHLGQELGKTPSEGELARQTGLTRGQIRRCRLLIDLPQQYKDELLAELQKPKSRQKTTEDLFIEMERALKSVKKHMPQALDELDLARRTLIDKHKASTIPTVIDFRMISKIARAERVGASPEAARDALLKLFEWNDYSIADAYHDTVEWAYDERDIQTRISGLIGRLDALVEEEEGSTVEDDVRELLAQLRDRITKILETA